MPNTSDNLPSIVGQPGGVPQLRAAVPRLDYSGSEALAKAGDSLLRAGGNLAGALVNLKNEEDMTQAKQALINANNELDIFLAEEQQKRGVNAVGAMERFQTQYRDIRERHGRELAGVGRKTYQMQLDNAYGSLYSRVFGHQATEADRASAIANNQIAAFARKKLDDNPDDDTAADNYFSVMDAEWDRVGLSPKDRAELYAQHCQDIGKTRVAAQLKAGNLAGARTLLERYKPDGKERFRLDQGSFDSMKMKVDAYEAVDRPYRVSDAVFNETCAKFDFRSHDPTVFFQAGRDELRKALTGKERDKALELYNASVKEHETVIKAQQDEFCAKRLRFYRDMPFKQSEEHMEKRLLEVHNAKFAERVRSEFHGYFGTGKADALEQRRAMEKTLQDVQQKKLNPEEARNTFVNNGGNCDDASLKKLDRAVSAKISLPDYEMVVSVADKFGYKKNLPGGFYEYLLDTAEPGKVRDRADIQKEMAAYLASTEVMFQNEIFGLWKSDYLVRDRKHNMITAMNDIFPLVRDREGLIYREQKHILRSYRTERARLLAKGGDLPELFEEPTPTNDTLTRYAMRQGWYPDAEGKIFKRDEKLDKRNYERWQKQGVK